VLDCRHSIDIEVNIRCRSGSRHRLRREDHAMSTTPIRIFQHSRNVVEHAAGSVLFTKGEPGDAMFAVIDGSVDVSVDGVVVEHVGAGGIVGEMALIDADARSATAVVREPARIVRVDQQEFVYLVQEHPTFALQVMRVMAERLRRANELRTGG
jgi:CRP-like cAMP-binding protein